MQAPRTRVEPVQARLRSAILSGELAPGAKLPLAELAGRLECRVGLVREALIRLASESLVVSEPQVGFRVAPVSARDLRELIETRCVIECEAFLRAIEEGSREWEGAVMAAYHTLEGLEHDDGVRTSGEWVAAHRRFHEVLIEGCNNRRMIAVTMSLRDSAELYRSSSTASMTDGQSAHRDSEHLALRDAALTRDVVGGPALLREHIRMTAHYFNLSH
ncbi:GntR family transcriptional regulator [Herbiconiux liukaitaii]|uniref:GntR family transcriptional regulator n=1 Tax=Herbiconiux liukaitaii TaxID=3342799 RepID=UPI0035B7A112